MRRETHSGFTLLEVMVAVAILALSLTAIFTSEAGAIKMVARSRKMGLATLLVRCKMGEIEEKVASEGLPALYDSGSDECCKDGPVDGYTCDWEIEPIVLPDNMFAPESDDDQAKSDPTAKLGAALGFAPGAQGDKSGGASTPPGINPTTGQFDPSSLMSGTADMGGLESMAIGFVYPVLKPFFESQIRRTTVTIHWKEGTVEHQFDVTQYMVSDQAIPNPDDATDQSGGTTAGGATGAPGAAPTLPQGLGR